MTKVRYPTRCIVVDVDGMTHPEVDLPMRTPEASKPHVGKHGTAEMQDDGRVRIDLDDGSVLYGDECWWVPGKKVPC